MEHVKSGTRLDHLLNWCEEQSATDLHVQPSKPYHIRIHGKLSPHPD